MTSLRQGGFLLAKIHQLAERVFSRMLREENITEINPAQGRILFALWQGDGIPIQELASRTALQKTTLTTMLERLQEAGFITRNPSERDGRETLVHLTEQNRIMKMQYEEVSEKMIGLFYRGFDQQEIDLFENSLSRILENLNKAEEEIRQVPVIHNS